MKYEPTQKGNPHGLTINQHVFPKRSIDRFTNAKGEIQVFLKQAGKTIEVRSTNPLFCARRAWDQRAEALVMKSIEDRFQPIANAVAHRGHSAWLHFSHREISQFFALWKARFEAFCSPPPDAKLKGVIGLERPLSKNDQEVLESKFYTYVNNDLALPGRHMAGIKIQMQIMREAASLGGMRWGVWIANPGAGSFIAPDSFGGHMIIPIAPNICLVGNSPNHYATRPEIAEINRIALAASKNHFFANDLSHCPLVS